MRFIARLLRRQPAPAPVYTTDTKEGLRPDGSWTAELRKDGVPYQLVEVGSISTLIAQSR